MKIFCYRLLLLFSIITLVSTTLFAGVVKKMFMLPDHGLLYVQIPSNWQTDVKYPGNRLPPTIRISNRSGERFTLLITPIWKTPRAQPDFGTPEGVYKLVKSTAANLASRAKEKRLIIRRTKGKNIGYYFTATDNAPEPGGFKYLDQGIVVTGDLLVTFTVLTDRPKSRIARQSLKMLGNAKHLK